MVLALLRFFTIFVFHATTRLDALFKKLRSLNDRKEIKLQSFMHLKMKIIIHSVYGPMILGLLPV